MFKFLALIGVLALIYFIFGWATLLPGIIGGVILVIWMAKRGGTGSTAIHQDEWFVEDNERGNRFMIGDPLDIPSSVSDAERRAVMQKLCSQQIQMTPLLLSMRQRVLNDPHFLATPEGIETTNAMGGAAFDLADAHVSNWKTNDFRKMGLEMLVA